MAEAGDSIYGKAIDTPLMKQFFNRDIDPYIAEALLLSDNPDKLLVKISDETQIVVNKMREALADAEKEIIIFTPYFIPRERGIEFIRELRTRGIRIIILTNSLATNNHTSVHSAYSSYRKDLLRAGVELWEARVDAAKFTTEEGETQLEHLTLHTKGALIDGKRIFVGSLNLDPRSIDINTEMGLLIDSPELGVRLTKTAIQSIPHIGYRLQLGEDNRITWHAVIDGREVVETKEPQTSMWKRFTAWFLKIAPENQL
jgi:putative cardiolipin synthase